MQSTNLFNERLKMTLIEATEQVTASELLKKRILNKISNQKMKEGYSMRNIKNLRKVAIIAAAICCLTSVSVYAAGKISSYVSTSSKAATYTELPSENELSNKLGFTPKTVNSFSNGYKFESANIIDTKGVDDNNKTVEKTKGFSSDYKSANGQKVILIVNIMKPDEAVTEKNTNVTKFNGIDIKYTEQMYKFVPENYKMTPEDIADRDSGKVVFSYGSDNVVSDTFKFIKWSDKGVNYTIMTRDSNMSEAELTGMAEEFINQ